MNKPLADTADNLRSFITDTEEKEGELTLTKQEFIDKMLQEKKGEALLDLLAAGEWRVAENLGLILGYRENGKAYFKIPRWRNLVAHLQIVESV
jgi:hypothetical protein